MLELVLEVLYRMVAVVSDFDRVCAEISSLKHQATKWHRMGKQELVNKFLDEISDREKEKKIIEELCIDGFDCIISQLRVRIIDLKVSVEQYEEIVTETAKAEQAYNLIKSSDIFENSTTSILGAAGKAEFARELLSAKEQSDKALERLKDMALMYTTKSSSEEESNEQ